MSEMIRVVSGVLVSKMPTKFAFGEKDEWKVLVAQRRQDQRLPLKWHLPGGKVEKGETDKEAVARELLEELNTKVIVGDEVMNFTIRYPHGLFNVHFYRTMGFVGIPSNDNNEHNEIRWCSEYDIGAFPIDSWLEADLFAAQLILMEMRCK